MVRLSRSKAFLVAVHFAKCADVPALRILLSQNDIAKDMLLQILLTYLPESLDCAEYVPFLDDFISGTIEASTQADEPFDSSVVDNRTEKQAKKDARHTSLLPLKGAGAPSDIPSDPLVLFLVHRSLRIDEYTGQLDLIPQLLTPLFHHSPYLRTWLVSAVLPLIRFNYEYHTMETATISISQFDSLTERAAVSLLLSKTGTDEVYPVQKTVGRDIRGLVGPWMFGDRRWKRRKIGLMSNENISPLDDTPADVNKYMGWEEVFTWICEKAAGPWETAVQAVEQWEGPGDVDIGDYKDGSSWVNEDDQQHLEVRYARSILAAAYLVTDTSADALSGVDRMVARLTTLMDEPKLPPLQQAAAMLLPIEDVSELLVSRNAGYLRNDFMKDESPLTTPKKASILLIHALVNSAFICSRAGAPLSVREAGELVLLQDKSDQNTSFLKFLARGIEHPKQDEKYWARTRNEILWLRNWGGEQVPKADSTKYGRGIFGRLPIEDIERELLGALLRSSYTGLAKAIYETPAEKPLPPNILQETILTAALKAFENATNANKTRGSVKKSLDIILAFSHTLANSPEAEQFRHLIEVTHTMGNYKLVFKQGEPFKPVQLLVHSDPISIIGKILDQNPKSYSQISDLIDIGTGMVKSGLVSKPSTGYSLLRSLDGEEVKKGTSDAEKRVVSMCIDAALAEDDFETAYSYIVTRLKDIASPAHARAPGARPNSQGMFPGMPPKIIDDWSWRAALQAGKYRRSANTIKPTHLGNTNANLEIRHLEQRMECLSQALRLAPKATLQEILNVYRRCEEELESLYKREAEQEEAWDAEGDKTAMPGGFDPTPVKKAPATRGGTEEAPMSLFDLSRASAKRAQSGFASLATARSVQSKIAPEALARFSGETTRTAFDNGAATAPVRKRDQFRNVAVGGLASGVGWLIGAPPVRKSIEEERD